MQQLNQQVPNQQQVNHSHQLCQQLGTLPHQDSQQHQQTASNINQINNQQSERTVQQSSTTTFGPQTTGQQPNTTQPIVYQQLVHAQQLPNTPHVQPKSGIQQISTITPSVTQSSPTFTPLKIVSDTLATNISNLIPDSTANDSAPPQTKNTSSSLSTAKPNNNTQISQEEKQGFRAPKTRRSNRSSNERVPKLSVTGIEHGTLINCHMENKPKTITFKFDIRDVNPTEIANKLIAQNLLSKYQSVVFAEMINDIIQQVELNPGQIPVPTYCRNMEKVRHASLTRQRSAFRTHQRHRSRDETSSDISKMFEPTILTAEPLSSNVSTFVVAKSNTMPSTITSLETSNEHTADQDTSFSPGTIISSGNLNLNTIVTATTASMSSSTTTSDTANNSSDNVIGSGSASRKTSTASEYTSLSSDYTPDNTITSSTSAFAMENPPNDANDEVEICGEILTSTPQSIADVAVSNTLGITVTSNAVLSLEIPENQKGSVETSDGTGQFTEAERATYIQTSSKINDLELGQDNINDQGQKSIGATAVMPPVSTARKISRFLVNPVITSCGDGTLEVITTSQAIQNRHTSMVMKTDEGIGDSQDKVPHLSTEIQEDNQSVILDLSDSAIVTEASIDNLSNISTSALITAAPLSLASTNTVTTPSILSAVGANNTLEQLKIELENITHAHAFANSVVASLNNTTDQNQQQSTTQPPITALSTAPQQQHQDEINKQSPITSAQSLGRSTPTGFLNSARGSSVYNSRRTSLDISCGSDFQHLTTNVIEGLETSYQVPCTTVRSSSGAASCTSAHTPIDANSEVGGAGGSASSMSAGAGYIEFNTGNRQAGGLSKSSLADLEKKLAALRHVDVVDEIKAVTPVQCTNTKVSEDQRNSRKISRFSVSRVQEQKSGGGIGNGNLSDAPTTPPINAEPQQLRIDLQTIAQQTFNQTKSDIVNTPTEFTHIPGQYIAINNANSNQAIIYPQTLQQQNSTQVQNVQPAQSYTQTQINTQVLQQQQFLQQLLLQKRSATPTLQLPNLFHQNFNQVQPNVAQQQVFQQHTSQVNQPNIPHQQQSTILQQQQQQLSQQSQTQQKHVQLSNSNSHVQNVQIQNQQTKNQQPVQLQQVTNQSQLQIQQAHNQQSVQNQQAFQTQQQIQVVHVHNQQHTPIPQQIQNQLQSQNPIQQQPPSVTRPQHQQSQNLMQQTNQQHIVVTQHSQAPYPSGEISDTPVLMPVLNEEPVSLAATHPQLLPTVIQSDIKHNLDSLVNQLCNLRLRTNQHQRLLLLRQRQLIEEDELRLKHYVEYEKFQKALRQSGETQPQVLYVQPTTSQHGFLNLGGGNFLHQINEVKPITNIQSAYAVGINQTQPLPQQISSQMQQQQAQSQQSIQMGQFSNQTAVTSTTSCGNINQEQQTQQQQHIQKILPQVLANNENNIQCVSHITDGSLATLIHVLSQINSNPERTPEMAVKANHAEDKLPSVQSE
uniref:Serine/threonine-protein kinase WNK CCTL2 domain-containing protein n=2 Tax=Bactrocera dorsalis TaxID=27457 RepID=A0A034V7L2_BACDO